MLPIANLQYLAEKTEDMVYYGDIKVMRQTSTRSVGMGGQVQYLAESMILKK
jgi:hypothetical protein